MEIVSARLRAARLRKGLNQQQLAAALEMDQANVSRAEKGIRGLSSEQIRRAARILEVTTDFLLGTDLNERGADTLSQEPQGEQARIIGDQLTPSGLRELAQDVDLIVMLRITEDEWHALSSISLPGEVNRDGYVQLLLTIRAICHT